MRFKGKTVIITGAGRGIGKAYALGFAREGANIVIAEINTEDAASVAREIKEMESEALIVRVDVREKDDVEEMVKKTINEFSKIDVLVNNAGIWFSSSVLGSSEEIWDKLFEVNVKGTFLCVQAVAKEMVKQKSGKIIIVSSIAAVVGQPNLAAYSASKGAVLSLTRVAALELAPYNINVNAILPGTTNTEMAKEALRDPIIRKKLTENIPLGRLGKPEDHVGAVLYFASEEANWCTGQTIIVDGGYSMV
jgi:NAD(P)-dependent dehydrogenase (short-subunit alcohol dehydrogenase family)